MNLAKNPDFSGEGESMAPAARTTAPKHTVHVAMSSRINDASVIQRPVVDVLVIPRKRSSAVASYLER